MIKDRPRRLQRLFANPALFFVTFGPSDCKPIPSLETANDTLIQYALRASEELRNILLDG